MHDPTQRKAAAIHLDPPELPFAAVVGKVFATAGLSGLILGLAATPVASMLGVPGGWIAAAALGACCGCFFGAIHLFLSLRNRAERGAVARNAAAKALMSRIKAGKTPPGVTDNEICEAVLRATGCTAGQLGGMSHELLLEVEHKTRRTLPRVWIVNTPFIQEHGGAKPEQVNIYDRGRTSARAFIDRSGLTGKLIMLLGAWSGMLRELLFTRRVRRFARPKSGPKGYMLSFRHERPSLEKPNAEGKGGLPISEDALVIVAPEDFETVGMSHTTGSWVLRFYQDMQPGAFEVYDPSAAGKLPWWPTITAAVQSSDPIARTGTAPTAKGTAMVRAA